jgi:membrane-associated phospholipid phosphatase
MDSTLRSGRRRTHNAVFRMFRPAPGPHRPVHAPDRQALIEGLAGAAAFVGVLYFIAHSIDQQTARVAAGVDPSARRLLLSFSELGSSGWMLVASGLVGLVALALAANARRPRDQVGFAVLSTRAGFLFLVVALSVALAQAIKFAIGRAHPHLLEHFNAFQFQMFSAESALASFPSGHATTAFAAAAVLAIFVPRLQAVFFVLALAISVARVATGIHFPSDVLGGMVLGVTLAIALARYFARRKIVFHMVEGRIVRRGERLVRRALRGAWAVERQPIARPQ